LTPLLLKKIRKLWKSKFLTAKRNGIPVSFGAFWKILLYEVCYVGN
jgi:hypothetical protein